MINIKSLFAIMFSISCFIKLSAQSVDWKNDVKEIVSISPTDSDFEDLQFLKSYLNGKRIILIGEQNHGDGATVEAKIRLVKFLHQEMGFNILVFETDFYSTFRTNQNYINEKATIDDVRKSLNEVWSATSTIDPLFDYIEKEKSAIPLNFLGIDCRHDRPFSKKKLLNDIDTMIMALNVKPNMEHFEQFKDILSNVLQNEYNSNINKEESHLFFEFIDELSATIINEDIKEKEFWIQELSNITAFVKNSSGKRDIRDIQMADNLNWLATKKYPTGKIIVWAHNAHILRNWSEIKEANENINVDLITLGDILTDELKNETYYLGFTSYSGTYSNLAWQGNFNEVKMIEIPKTNTIETEIMKLGFDYAFLDFSKLKDSSELKSRLPMQGIDHSITIANWTKIYDGIFFINEMFPVKAKSKNNRD